MCVIGAGSSGIASCQVLHARGIPFDCFEMGSEVGGNWRYMNDNGQSSAYESLSINTSRQIMEYAAYPMPEDYPDFPTHRQIAAYFDAYVDHFGFRDQIRFRTEVTHVERATAGQGWSVTLDDGTTTTYEAVFVANGHHWDPRWPEPDFPGEFHGEVTHAHHYKTPAGYEGKNVLVLGIGNSACDIAVETSRVSNRTFMAMRRGAWIIPKYFGSTPLDQLSPEWLGAVVPFSVLRVALMRQIKATNGHPADFGLPVPDHKLGEAHPTVSSDLLGRIGHGRITVKPNIERLEGDSVRFADGSVEPIDRIVYCTGYKISFPFLDHDLLDPSGTTASSCTGAWCTQTCRAFISSGSCSRSTRSCRSPSASRSGSPTCSWATWRCPIAPPWALRSGARTKRCDAATWRPSDTRSRSTARPTCANWRWSGVATGLARANAGPSSACESCFRYEAQQREGEP